MHEVTPEEAKQHLAGLVEAALRGEDVLIARDQQHAVRLVPVRGARGLIALREDFDAPLPNFDEYMA